MMRAQASLIGILIVGSLSIAACDLDPTIGADGVETVQSALINSPCGMVPTTSVCVCQDPGFTGICTNLTTDLRFFGNLSTILSGHFNDSISSVWIGPDAKIKACEHPGMAGLCASATGGPNGTSLLDLGSGCGPGGQACCSTGTCPDPWCCQNNRTSSLRVDNKADDCQNPGLSRVAFFTDINYSGDCVVLFRQIGVHIGWPDPNGNATNATQGGSFGLPDNSISSVKIGVPGMGHNFDIYDGVNYTGSDFFNGASVPDLRSVGWNDLTSAISTVN
jgi:hypothetical protein